MGHVDPIPTGGNYSGYRRHEWAPLGQHAGGLMTVGAIRIRIRFVYHLIRPSYQRGDTSPHISYLHRTNSSNLATGHSYPWDQYSLAPNVHPARLGHRACAQQPRISAKRGYRRKRSDRRIRNMIITKGPRFSPPHTNHLEACTRGPSLHLAGRAPASWLGISCGFPVLNRHIPCFPRAIPKNITSPRKKSTRRTPSRLSPPVATVSPPW